MATTEYQAAMAKLAEDTITVDATSADVAKAAKTKGAAAKGTTYHVKAICHHAKAVAVIHSFYFSVAGGVIIGVAAYHLVNKFWLNKDECC